MKGSQKAASIYRILGENLPMEVFNYLSTKEIEKLLNKLYSSSNPVKKKEEAIILKEFVEKLSSLEKSPKDPERILEEDRLIREIQELLKEEENESPLNPSEFLSSLNLETVSRLLVDESPHIIAAVLFFAPDEMSKFLIEDLPVPLKEAVILEMGEMDFHSFQLRDELERFLQFKLSLIHSDENLVLKKIKGRESKKAAHLLNYLNPRESQEILSKIKKKRPKFAENIVEYYYSFRDLLFLGRKSLSDFLSEFHPLVVATALKGVESELEEEILSLVEPWISKEIRLESQSLGSVSLAEIEEAQNGILDCLREELEAGRLKLWRFK